MASCTTARWGNNNSPYLQLNVSESSSTSTTVTLSWSVVWYEPYTYYASASSEYEVYIDGSTVRSSSLVPSNLSSGTTLASGTKTVDRSSSSRSVSIGVWWNPKGSWNGTYSSSQSGSSSITIGAISSYVISFDANGGTDAPPSQTKNADVALTITSDIPTKEGYDFLGWATSAADATAGIVAYTSGSSYTANASATLYAVWAESYFEPNKLEVISAHVDNGVLNAIVITNDIHVHGVEWRVSNSSGSIGEVVAGHNKLQLTTNVDPTWEDVYVRAYAISSKGIVCESSAPILAVARPSYKFNFKIPDGEYIYPNSSAYPSSSTYPKKPNMPKGIKFKSTGDSGALKFYIPINLEYPNDTTYPSDSMYPIDL